MEAGSGSMNPNPGHYPPEAIGKRVKVRLRDGTIQGDKPVNTDSKLGWAAETTDWSLTDHPFDVVEWELA